MSWFSRKSKDVAVVAHPNDEHVECSKCGHIVSSRSAQFVEAHFVNFPLSPPSNQYYCRNCRLPYDKVSIGFAKKRYYKRLPAGFIETDNMGNLLGNCPCCGQPPKLHGENSSEVK